MAHSLRETNIPLAAVDHGVALTRIDMKEHVNPSLMETLSAAGYTSPVDIGDIKHQRCMK